MAQKPNLKLILALFSIGLFWGTTYLAIRIGVETISPMLVVGFRNLIAGGIVFAYLAFNKQLESMTVSRIKQNIIISFMLIILSNGLTTFSEQYIPSGLAALIATLSTLIILLLNLGLKHEKFSSKVFSGLVLALSGIYFIYQNSLRDFFNPHYRMGIIAILTVTFTWAIGTVYSKSIAKHFGNMLVDLCFQMLFAGIFLLLIQLIIQPGAYLSSWSFRSMSAVIYLAVFGSVAGYVSYLYALTQLPSTQVSIFNYVNVVVALFLGWLILDEKITLKIILATIFILTGVIIANLPKRKQYRELEANDSMAIQATKKSADSTF